MDTFDGAAAVAHPARRSWRRHSDEFKARVIALASQPQASVAAVALANGLNANMLRRWVREAGARTDERLPTPARGAPLTTGFVQLPMVEESSASSLASSVSSPSPTPPEAPTVFVELHRGLTSVYVTLPLGADSAAWLREVLA